MAKGCFPVLTPSGPGAPDVNYASSLSRSPWETERSIDSYLSVTRAMRRLPAAGTKVADLENLWRRSMRPFPSILTAFCSIRRRASVGIWTQGGPRRGFRFAVHQKIDAYSSTWPVNPGSVGGSSRPSALAVLRYQVDFRVQLCRRTAPRFTRCRTRPTSLVCGESYRRCWLRRPLGAKCSAFKSKHICLRQI
jgi:hypothetical protein